MLTFEEKKESIMNCTKDSIKMTNFFIKGFDKFNLEDQVKILSVFEIYMKRNENGNDWNKYLHHHPDVIERIIKVINMPICLGNEDIDEKTKNRLINSFLNILYYTPYNDFKKEEDLNQITKYLIDNYKKYELNELSTTLSIILKNVKEFNAEMLSPEKIEEIINYYFNNINYNNIYDNEVLNLLIESPVNINKTKTLDIIRSKISSDVPYNKYIIERIDNKCLNIETCTEILGIKDIPDSLKRVAMVDYMKNFLENYGVKDSKIIYDDQIYIEGLAIGNLIRINCNSLNITCFHEAMHVIQNCDFEQGKFYGNRYYMLKDKIISRYISYDVYRNNYSSFLFEEEAETLGEIHRLYYKQKFEFFGESDEERLNNLLGGEIRVNDKIIINGETIKKSTIFDNIIKNNLDLLNKYPILMVEYNKDGSKKQVEEIIKSINNLGKTEEERLSIYSCIFENKYEKSYDDEVIGKKSSRV